MHTVSGSFPYPIFIIPAHACGFDSFPYVDFVICDIQREEFVGILIGCRRDRQSDLHDDFSGFKTPAGFWIFSIPGAQRPISEMLCELSGSSLSWSQGLLCLHGHLMFNNIAASIMEPVSNNHKKKQGPRSPAMLLVYFS